LAYHYQDYWVASVPKPQVDLSSVAPAKGEGQGLIVPIPKEGIGSVVPKPQVEGADSRMESAHLPLGPLVQGRQESSNLESQPVVSTQGNEIQIPDDLKGRTAIDSSIAMEFTTNFYEVSYDVPSHELKTLDEYTNDHYTKAFFKEFFPPSKLKDIRSKKLNTVFQTSGPVKLLKLDKDSCEFLVEGVVT
jgi:hypothetical protein